MLSINQKKGKDSIYIGGEVPDMAEVHGGGSGRGSPEPAPPKPARLTLSSAVENEISGEEYEDRIDFRYVKRSTGLFPGCVNIG